MCLFHQAHSTPKLGWTDRGKDRLQKGFTVKVMEKVMEKSWNDMEFVFENCVGTLISLFC